MIHSPTRKEVLGNKIVTSCRDRQYVSQRLADHYFIACEITSENLIEEATQTKRQVEIVDKKVFDQLVSAFHLQDLLLNDNYDDVYYTFQQLWTFTNQSKTLSHSENAARNTFIRISYLPSGTKTH